MAPQYVILDTCIWLDFLRDEQGDKLLSIIDELQKKNAIKLIVSELIEKEWKKNHPSLIQPKPDKNLLNNSESFIKVLYDNESQSRKEIVARVEKLFKVAIQPLISDTVKVDATDRFMNRKAPFHTKRDSMNDCLIYFSGVEWCKTNQIRSIAFVTRNINDFSDTTHDNKLHPELEVQGLEVSYYTNLQYFLATIDPDCFRRLDEKKYGEAIILPGLVTDEPILTQWYNAFEYYYRQLNFIPRRLMSRLYPMCHSNKMPIGHYDKGIYISNETLINYLQGIENIDFNGEYNAINSSISREEFGKTKEIFKGLNRGHVHELRVRRPEMKFKCLIQRDIFCSCVRCTYTQLHLVSSMDALLPEPTEDYQENLKQGYIRFLIRDYALSAKFFYQVYQHAKKEKLPVMQLAMAQKIKKLTGWVKNFYRAEDAYLELEKLKVEEVDPMYAANMQMDLFVIESSKLIYQRHFFVTVQIQIIELRNEIAEHYEKQLAGGYQSNTNLNHLYFTFAELKAFYETNVIIVNLNNEAFRDVYAYVAESYLMCHQFNKGQSSRLLQFTDNLVLEMVLYSRPDDLRKHFSKYKIKTLRYHYESDCSETVNAIVQLLADLPKLATFTSSEGELHHLQTLTDKYYSYLSNLLFLSSFLTFTEEDNKRIAKAIVEVIKLLDQYPRFYKDVYGVVLYLSEKYTAFTQDDLVEIIHHSFKEQNWQKDDWLQQMGDCFSDKRSLILEKNLSLSEMVYEYITTLEEDDTLETKINYLTSWYDVLHPQHKVMLSEAITRQLREKFTPELYYQAVLYGVCDYQEFYKTYIDVVGVPSLEDTPEDKLFPAYERLGDLLNLVFSLNLSTSGEAFDKFRNRQDYYDWLMDLDHFDYTRFDIKWVVKYQTRFYFQRIFGSKQAREEIRDRLVKSPNGYISNLYLKYTAY